MYVIHASTDLQFAHYAALLRRWQQSRSSAGVAFSTHCLPQQSVPAKKVENAVYQQRVACCRLTDIFFCSSCSDYIFKGFTRSGRLNCNDVILCPFCISDDGKLSFEEFNTYFADGILTTEELQELFYSIDGRQNRWPFRYELLQSCWVSVLVRKAIISSLYHGLNPAVKMARTSHFLSNRETFAQQ